MKIAQRFAIDGQLRSATPYGTGHINDTLLAEFKGPQGVARFILQRLNPRVVRDPKGVMENIERVTAHLRARNHRTLELVPARDGRPFCIDDAGDWWRSYRYVEGAHSRDRLEHAGQGVEPARAFGAFVAALTDLPPPGLVETLPGFHDLAGRYRAFESALETDRVARAAELGPEIDGCRALFARVAQLLSSTDASRLPRRIVHNDCKLNNVLIDDTTGEGCVVDLDTVMEGTILADFGDLVRTAACTAEEDARDLASVDFDLDRFEALAGGYLSGCGALLTPAEIQALPAAGPAQALENALRFLSDHLDGDRYFRIHRDGHNLDRHRAQRRLAERMLERVEEARRVLAGIPSPV